MKKALSLVALLLGALSAQAAHVQSANVRVGPLAEERIAESAPASKKEEKAAAARPNPRNDSKDEPKRVNAEEARKAARDEKKKNDAATKTPTAVSANTSAASPSESSAPAMTSDAPSKSTNGASVPLGSPSQNILPADTSDSGSFPNSPPKTSAPLTVSASTSATAASSALSSIYRIGAGDVLDIRLLNDTNPRASTLFTVMAGGLLEYPLAGDPLNVAGMTTEELSGQLIAELKRRAVYEKPQVRVSVREYTSHTVMVSGLANDPGAKILRREAVPLYVVIAEAQPKPEAGRAVVIAHNDGQSKTIDLNDAVAMNVLVHPGDVVTLISRPPEFYFIGGQIGSPGQKDFHAGLTLTQSVLASGGVTRAAGATMIRVSRQGADGRLVSTEYVLQNIEGGKIPDPVLQPGDRIEVGNRKK